jgi:xanthine/uracil permease
MRQPQPRYWFVAFPVFFVSWCFSTILPPVMLIPRVHFRDDQETYITTMFLMAWGVASSFIFYMLFTSMRLSARVLQLEQRLNSSQQSETASQAPGPGPTPPANSN